MTDSSCTGAAGSQPPSQDNGLESTHIPKAYARWQEESTALDGHASHLVMRTLRDTLIQRMVEVYKQENATKDTPKSKAPQQPTVGSSTVGPASVAASSAVPATPGSGGGGSGMQVTERSIPVAPHPSDQVTPSSHSPREAGSTVDQLRSSLRQVADALAQTVAAVRTTREQLLGGREEEDASEREEGMDEGAQVITSSPPPPPPPPVSSAPPFPLPSVLPFSIGQQTPLPVAPSSGQDAVPHSTAMTQSTAVDRPLLMAASVSSPAPPPLVATPLTPPSAVPMLSTFDGSQESAAATLASTDPTDPLHTFLSAIVGAPAPPLLGSSSTPSQASPASNNQATLASASTIHTAPLSLISTASPTLTSTSPRLPVFTRLQQSDANSATPPALTQESTELPPSEDSTMSIGSPATTTALPFSTAANSFSQSSMFSATSQNQDPSHPAEELARATSQRQDAADPRTAHLAEELARMVSQLVPVTASSSSSSSIYSSASLHAPPSSTGRNSSSVGELAAGQSPSPSDMLAPLLMSSLQMPSSSSSVGTASPRPSAESVSTAATSVLTGQQVDPSTMQPSPNPLPMPRVFGNHHRRAVHVVNIPVPQDTGVPGVGAAPTVQDTPPTVQDSLQVTQSSGQTRQGPQPTSMGLLGTPDVPPATVRYVTVFSPSGAVEVPVPVTTTVTNIQRLRRSPACQATPLHTTPTATITTSPPTTTAATASQEGGGAAVQGMPSLTNIDPTFLAALPDAIRQEVMAQHEREQRLLRAQREASFTSSISPEFLAALPPNIQEEVPTATILTNTPLAVTLAFLLVWFA